MFATPKQQARLDKFADIFSLGFTEKKYVSYTEDHKDPIIYTIVKNTVYGGYDESNFKYLSKMGFILVDIYAGKSKQLTIKVRDV